MSNPASDDGTEQLPIEELSIEDLELLARARHQRKRESVPEPVRERLLSRALEEASRSEPSLVVPAGEFVVVQPRGWGFALGWVAAVALGVLGLTQARGWFADEDGSVTPSAEGSGSGANAAARMLGDRLFQSSLFHAPAESLSKDVSAAGALPPAEASLFGERPFSAQSRAWQVRRWDDLRA